MKITVIGASGYVGSNVAFILALQGLADELVLVAPNRTNLVEHLAMDMATAITDKKVIIRPGGYDDMKDSNIVIMCGGAPQGLIKSRMEMLDKNLPIIRDVGEKVRIGYLPEYRALDPEWGKCLTDLIYFSIQPLPDGSLDNSALNIQTLQMLREMHTAYGTRIHVSIGGWERSNNFAPMATEPKARKNFVGNLISFCLENELDGIDFDWEFPENEREIQAYADLLTEVKAAFRPRGWIVSVALAPSDQINLAPYAAVDRIHIMSYDRGSKHATPEQAQQDVALFLSTGVAQKRLILGMPFYGRSITPPHEEYLYAEIMARYHPSPTTDEVDNIYFNGIGTIQQKTCLAKTERLGGVMVWELGQDSHDDTSLLSHAVFTWFSVAINLCFLEHRASS